MQEPLIIGVDIRDLRISISGTKTSLEEISKQFARMESEKYRFHFFDTVFPVYTGKNKLYKLVEHIRFQLWKQIILPVKAFSKRCDIVFCNDYFVPLIHLGYKTIPVFHDAFFYEYPGHYNKIWLWIFRLTAVPAAKRSPFVISQSKHSRETVHHYTNIPKNKIVPVYVAPKNLETGSDTYQSFSNPVLQSLENNTRYLLHVGSLDKRKNIPRLIEAFKILIDQGYTDLRLVLIGASVQKMHSDGTNEVIDSIQRNQLQSYVILPGYLSNADVMLAYKKAFLYVFPSYNEGFGVPVLEAFKYNLPAVVAGNTCLPEIGGDAVVTFDPFDINDIAEKIKKVMEDEVLRAGMIAKGQKRLQDFSWEKTAVHLLSIFEATVKKSKNEEHRMPDMP